MEEKIIELELRAEILPKELNSLLKSIGRIGTLHSRTKRLSVMFFGSIGVKKLDIRVRITNGTCEIVVKSGSFGSHERVEVTQKISADQFLGMVKIFSQFNFSMEVGEREIINYKLPNEIVISLVSAGPITYIELEKMSSRSDLDKNKKQLKRIADQLKLKILRSDKEFNALCKRLSETVDWPFHCTNNEYTKLTKLAKRYTNFQRKTAKKN